ncbi:hypothetical protein DQ04_00081200 [Trypanosoma grayi]|uniref:hypothetical protein n=1 Tax=Trypanosoma grayi TaxID=71804 RepID=UPI0004F450B8|nr:hypothetical protein DQ04_00081200 [Trypanosoma grayi]KEG15421.1 hypothetical protein DQ04_00081200 [Trypanosoma grayi]
METRLLQDMWAAVQAFLEFGSSDAGAFLREHSRQAARTANITRQSYPPLMLEDALAKFYAGGVAAPPLLLVAILNRMFCMEAIPAAVARPVNDTRPVDFSDLLRFYLDCLREPKLPGPVAAQLYLCASSLMLLQPGVNVVDALLCGFGGVVPSTTRDTRCFMKLLSGVMGVLSDRRVMIGPVRRSSQRLCVQSNMHLVLSCRPVEEEADLSEVAAVVAQGVTFLTECTVRDAQETAPLFWSQLPLSPFWRAALQRLQQGSASETVVEAVCAVLRSITVLDTGAVTLLLAALTAVLGDDARPAMPHVCRVITSALESAVETVVVQLGPEHTLYQAMASGAQALQHVLATPALMAASETGLVVCEGLCVLAQVLTPVALPEMDTTDDPDDYAMVVDDIKRGNRLKEEALMRLRGFVEGCQAALLAWVCRLSASDVRDVALYARQNDGDVFAARYDELPVALFMTYERLCTLLHPAQHAEVRALALQGYVTVSAWDAGLSCQALLAGGAVLLQQQHAPFVPLITSRFKTKWGPEQTSRVVSALAVLLGDAVMRSKSATSAASISEALCEMCAPAVPSMVEALWQGVHLTCDGDKTPRGVLASHLASLLEKGECSLPHGCLDNSQLDDHTLAELRSSILRSLQDVWRVMESLHRMEPDVSQSRRAAERIAVWAQRAAETGSLDLEQYDNAVRQWCKASPLHLCVTWRLVRALELTKRTAVAEILVDALELFVARVEEASEMSWGNGDDCFSPYVFDTISQSPHAPRLKCALSHLMMSSMHVSDNDRFLRLRVVVRGGNSLLHGRHCSPTLIVELFCDAAREYIGIQQGLSRATAFSAEEEAMEGGKGHGVQELLADLARLGRVVRLVPQLPVGAPAWLHAVGSAVDEFEIQRILKGDR